MHAEVNSTWLVASNQNVFRHRKRARIQLIAFAQLRIDKLPQVIEAADAGFRCQHKGLGLQVVHASFSKATGG